MRPGKGGLLGFGAGHHDAHGHFGLGRPHNRIFEQGDIRYVVLALLAERPFHGYELIKAIEERLNGAYAPSPGLIYPTLNLLDELGYATSADGEGGKRFYSITAAGKDFLQVNQALINSIFSRMSQAASQHKRSEAPEIVEAVDRLMAALKLKRSNELSDAQLQAIAAALAEAAQKIERC